MEDPQTVWICNIGILIDSMETFSGAPNIAVEYCLSKAWAKVPTT